MAYRLHFTPAHPPAMSQTHQTQSQLLPYWHPCHDIAAQNKANKLIIIINFYYSLLDQNLHFLMGTAVQPFVPPS